MKKTVLYAVMLLLATPTLADEATVRQQLVAVKATADTCQKAVETGVSANIVEQCAVKNIPGYLTPTGQTDIYSTMKVGECPAFLEAAGRYGALKSKFDAKPSAGANVVLNSNKKNVTEKYEACLASLTDKEKEAVPENKIVQLWD
ncbi:hypothetical protein [Asticcacaulis sp. MM231]|uniref:hypothetical protein n=1 Tax=Asticcacaulis sp. MM231 TaxID=3157666 RepID=UPI0032D578BB